jgi:hypothetical protein
MRKVLLILCRADISAESPDHPWPASGGPIAIGPIAWGETPQLRRSASAPVVQR